MLCSLAATIFTKGYVLFFFFEVKGGSGILARQITRSNGNGEGKKFSSDKGGIGVDSMQTKTCVEVEA